MVATTFFLLSANALGSRAVTDERKTPAPEHHMCTTLLGTALYILIMTLVGAAAGELRLDWGALAGGSS